MIQRRWATHIIRDILNEVMDLPGVGKSQIRFIASMNFYQAQDYIDFLLQRGFIASLPPANGESLYGITPKGRQLLDQINGLLQFMDVDEIEEAPQGNRHSSPRHREAVKVT